jgi:protein-tyrosine phosphatase
MKTPRRVEASLKGRFGTYRGLVRLILANCRWYMGSYRSLAAVDWRQVSRIVFACQGNICRSPFAEVIGRNLLPALPITSVGLSTTSGLPAFPLALRAASHFAADLSAHHARDIREFEFRDGDLVLVMEDRHVTQLHSHVQGCKVQVGLLGLWCRPRLALLYDPHSLSREYFVTCFERIYRAVGRLAEEASGSERHLRRR